MSTRTAVAVAQWGPGADRDVNLAELRELAQKAVDQGAGLVVFPEYSAYFTPKPDEGWVANAEPLDGPFVSGLSAIAAELEVIIVAGLLEESSQPEKCRNTIVAVGADGALLATSPKLHLYDAFGAQESRWVEPGEISAPQLFEFAGLRVGIQTCYDLRFPEVTRRLADAGADLVLVPALAVDARGHRIGFGKGFYDRLLPRLTNAFRVAVAFDFEQIAEVPNVETDAPVHAIVTDEKVLRVE